MIDNTHFTHIIACRLKYRPNFKDISYYKRYYNGETINQVRFSNYGTCLDTWVDNNYVPSNPSNTNISIVFAKDGIPTNNCLTSSQPFTVKQYVYNCEHLELNDALLIIQAIKQLVSTNEFNDPFEGTLKEAEIHILTTNNN